MKQLLLLFIGGGTGSVARYMISTYLNKVHTSIPFGTLVVNVLGSLLIGSILGLLSKEMIPPHIAILIATGFCGGFTTFSSFAYENHALIKNGEFLYFISYSIASFGIGMIAVAIGLWMVK